MNLVDYIEDFDLASPGAVVYGYRQGWVDKSYMSSYFSRLLLQEENNSNVDFLSLAFSTTLDINELESSISSILSKESLNIIIDKWRLAKLMKIKDSTITEEEKLISLEKVYSEFDYPEDMFACSIYSPANGDPLENMYEVIRLLKSRFDINDLKS